MNKRVVKPLQQRPLRPVRWLDGGLVLLDQRLLPQVEVYLHFDSCDGVASAIGEMVVRGAPAIGLADAYEGNVGDDDEHLGEDFTVEPNDDGPRPFTCFLDVGLHITSTGSKVFACMKGALDGGTESAKAALERWRALDGRRSCAVLAISYESFQRYFASHIEGDLQLDLLVFDEGHRLKGGAGSKTARAIRDCRAKRRLLITGTPAMNDLSEFHALADVVNPDVFGPLAAFKRDVAVPGAEELLRVCEQPDKVVALRGVLGLLGTIPRPGAARLVFVVDGLDECGADSDELTIPRLLALAAHAERRVVRRRPRGALELEAAVERGLQACKHEREAAQDGHARAQPRDRGVLRDLHAELVHLLLRVPTLVADLARDGQRVRRRDDGGIVRRQGLRAVGRQRLGRLRPLPHVQVPQLRSRPAAVSLCVSLSLPAPPAAAACGSSPSSCGRAAPSRGATPGARPLPR